MRYDSLLNSKKWPSDRPKGSATPCFLPTLSVLLLCFLPNHPFSNLDFSGLGQPVFLKFHFAVSKCSKFNNWPTFSKSITDLIHFRPHQTLCYFLAFWVCWPQPSDLYILEQISVIVRGEQAAIPHLKEHIQSFHMNPNAKIFISEISHFRAL